MIQNFDLSKKYWKKKSSINVFQITIFYKQLKMKFTALMIVASALFLGTNAQRYNDCGPRGGFNGRDRDRNGVDDRLQFGGLIRGGLQVDRNRNGIDDRIERGGLRGRC